MGMAGSTRDVFLASLKQGVVSVLDYCCGAVDAGCKVKFCGDLRLLWGYHAHPCTWAQPQGWRARHDVPRVVTMFQSLYGAATRVGRYAVSKTYACLCGACNLRHPGLPPLASRDGAPSARNAGPLSTSPRGPEASTRSGDLPRGGGLDLVALHPPAGAAEGRPLGGA